MINEAKLTELMEKYGDYIMRTCYLYLSDYSLAEDATQETFIKVYKNYEDFKGYSSEKTWITKIAINTCINIQKSSWFKRHLKDKSLDEPNENTMDVKDSGVKDISDSTVNIEDSVIDKSGVLDAIAKLNDKERMVVLLFYYQEMSAKEIAEMLNVRENTVLQRLSRARRRLKKYLEEEGYHE